jgi:hypothetical protein
MKIETPFIAFLVAILLFTGMWAFFQDIGNEYQAQGLMNSPPSMTVRNANGSMVSVDTVFIDMGENRSQTQAKFRRNFESLGLTWDGIGSAMNIMLAIGKQFVDSISILYRIFDVAAQLLGIPSQVIITFVVILIVIVILSAMSIIFGGVNQ